MIDENVKLINKGECGALIYVDSNMGIDKFIESIKKYFELDNNISVNACNIEKGLYHIPLNNKFLKGRKTYNNIIELLNDLRSHSIIYLNEDDESKLISNIDSEDANNTIECVSCGKLSHLVNDYTDNIKYFYCHECGNLMIVKNN